MVGAKKPKKEFGGVAHRLKPHWSNESRSRLQMEID
jgi:hypothetical protein